MRLLDGFRIRLIVPIVLGLALLVLPNTGWSKSARVGIVPFHLHSSQDIGYLVQGIRDMLSSRMAGPETELVELAQINQALTGLKLPLSPSSASTLAQRLKADYIVFGSITKLGPQFSLNWQVLKTADPGHPIGLARTATEDELIPVIDEMAGLARDVISGAPPTILVARPQKAKPEAGAQSQPAPAATAPAKPKKKRVIFGKAGQDQAADETSGAAFKVSGAAKSIYQVINVSPRPLMIAAGDLDGDKTDDILLLSEKALQIYTFRDGQPALKAKFNKPMPGRLMIASAGDLDRDGKAEIALTTLYGSLPRAAIFKLDGRRLRQIATISNHHLRIVDSPQGALIVGQESTVTSLYSGPFIRFGLAGSRLKRIGGVVGSSNIGLSTMALGDITGDGKIETIGLGTTEKLTVLSSAGRVLFRSGDEMGGTNNSIRLPNVDHQGDDYAYEINASTFLEDMDGDGRLEVLAVHNQDTARRISVNMSHFRKGSIFGFSWAGHLLSQKWQTPVVDEYIAGAEIVTLANGQRVLVMAATEPEFYGGTFKLFQKTKGFLIMAPMEVEQLDSQ